MELAVSQKEEESQNILGRRGRASGLNPLRRKNDAG